MRHTAKRRSSEDAIPAGLTETGARPSSISPQPRPAQIGYLSFNMALRIILKVAINQSSKNPRVLTWGDLDSVDGVQTTGIEGILRLLRSGLLIESDLGIRLRRPAHTIGLSEIYAAVLPPRNQVVTSFDRLYDAIMEQANAAAIAELDGIALSAALADLSGFKGVGQASRQGS